LDAGPHVKVICESKNSNIWKVELEKIPDIIQITVSKLGPGAYCEYGN
jgi:mevalonate pyrophosphate decarboxylase